ncbi:prostaglandin G/H synthase 1 isoform X4 [Gadus morhua]|uniref:prostaglandin G/H synthase 1 isoform X4 n=1 Tax=Gadus morhua TaxID=8049 RepID=UPI0011B464E2|nr:prostaglandin G/H synthase 1-like isoform X4 [Gadus morhua]
MMSARAADASLGAKTTGVKSTFAFFLLLLLLDMSLFTGATMVNPCCNYPCENSGTCVRFGTERFECDCTRTGFHGDNCTVPEFWTRIHHLLKPSPDTVHYLLTHFHWLWDVINSSFLRNILMRVVLTGKAVLPDPRDLVTRFLIRKKFRPDPQGANLMFAFFAQHFTHQFFKTHHRMGPAFTRALSHGVDAGHIYGDNLERQLQLRLHQDGKLRYQLIYGEMFPPTTQEVPVAMSYPSSVPPSQRLALGQEVFGLLPGLTLYSTLWLREHNRVCDVLKEVHPTWGDEQLFQTTRLIIIGETIRIVIEEYVQQLSGYLLKLKFDPTLIFNDQFQYSNRISLEFNHLYHWHPLMPDSFLVDGQDITYPDFLFNTSVLLHFGVEKLVDSFARQQAGQIGGGWNVHARLQEVVELVIKESRALRVQPFNEYRKKFELKPYASFYEFTDDKEMARQLEELYGDIDALEFYPGLLLERTRDSAIFGESMVEMGAPFSLKGLLGNPICSPVYWKPSTFGGAAGFDIVNSATLERLVCLNSRWCPYVSFHVPRSEEDHRPRDPSTEL